MIRSFNLFNFSKLEAGLTRKDGDPDAFPSVPSTSEPLDILARKDDVRFVMIDVDPADRGLMLLGPSSADWERNATVCFGDSEGVACSVFRQSPSTSKDDGL
jgi:hypothetical protein